jgi:hypothetical protein
MKYQPAMMCRLAIPNGLNDMRPFLIILAMVINHGSVPQRRLPCGPS